MPFPRQLPQDSVKRIADKFLGKSEQPTGVLIEDCYDVIGYGLYATVGVDAVRTELPLTNEAKAELLQQSLVSQGAIDWKSISLIVLQLLQQLLSQ